MALSLFRWMRGFRGHGRESTGAKLGEAGAAMALLRSAGRSRSTLGRMAKLVAGGALLYRAVGGRGALRRLRR